MKKYTNAEDLYWDVMNVADKKYDELKRKKYKELWHKECDKDEVFSIESNQIKALAYAFSKLLTEKTKKTKQ